MTRRQRTGHFLGYLTHSPIREDEDKKSRYLTRRVIELSAPKSRKYQDGTYEMGFDLKRIFLSSIYLLNIIPVRLHMGIASTNTSNIISNTDSVG